MKFDFSIPDADSKAYFTEPSRNRDSLKVWLTDSTLYSNDSDQHNFQIIRSLILWVNSDISRIHYYEIYHTQCHQGCEEVQRTVFTVESNISTGSLKPGQLIVFTSQNTFQTARYIKNQNSLKYYRQSQEKDPISA